MQINFALGACLMYPPGRIRIEEIERGNVPQYLAPLGASKKYER